MKTAKALALALVLLASLMGGPRFAADVYKWVDADGVVHYSDRPPADGTGIELSMPAAAEPPGQSTPTEPPGTVTTPTWYDQWLAGQRERRQLEREQREQHSAQRGALQAHMLEVCAEARQRLEVLETPCRAFFDGRGVLRSWCPNQATWVWKGEFRFIEDDERADMIRHYRAQLAECEAAGY